MSALKITSSNYTAEVEQSAVPVLIDFWAEWCGPCRMMAPVIEQIADEADGKYKVCSVNVDDESELAAKFSISAIPTFVVVKNGEITATVVGVHDKEDIIKMINR